MCGRGFGNLLLPLVAASILANEPVRPMPVATGQATCPHCKVTVSPAFEWCPECGTAMKSCVCAYCGNQMEIRASFCPSCGAPSSKKQRE